MNRTYLSLAALAALATISGCGAKDEDKAATPAATTAASEAPAPMASMTKPGVQLVKATGTVTSVNSSTGEITVAHDPIPEAGWPAMTMTFKATKDLALSVQADDKIAFDLTVTNGAGEITALHRTR